MSTPNSRPCIPLTIVDPDGDIPSSAAGAASIIAGDPASTGAHFGPFYAANVDGRNDQVVAAKVTVPGQSSVVGVWYVPFGTHLFAPVNPQAESITQAGMGLSRAVDPSTDHGYKTVVDCVNADAS